MVMQHCVQPILDQLRQAAKEPHTCDIFQLMNLQLPSHRLAKGWKQAVFGIRDEVRKAVLNHPLCVMLCAASDEASPVYYRVENISSRQRQLPDGSIANYSTVLLVEENVSAGFGAALQQREDAFAVLAMLNDRIRASTSKNSG